MCTLTFLPLEEYNFLLTSSRDEQKSRKSSSLPTLLAQGEVQILSPVDGDAGGSWIGITNTSRTLCLLNGAFKSHERNPPYRKSRGIILMDLLATSQKEDIMHYGFDNIEPFTLIWIEKNKKLLTLSEYRWDNQKLHHKQYDTKEGHIWSSATLYSAKVGEQRQRWFNDWLKNPSEQSLQDYIWQFHLEGGKKEGAKPSHQIFMRDDYGGTVSLTQITSSTNQLTMKHHNFVSTEKSFDVMEIVG